MGEENLPLTGQERSNIKHVASGTIKELHFRVTIQFITLREERIVEEINGKEKNAKLKKMSLL